MSATPTGSERSVLDEVKPRLRGWLHLASVPLALVGGLSLILFASTSAGRWAGLVYLIAALALFGNSALYHRGTWSPRTHTTLRRIDHANIFIFIAGSYTPLAVMMLSGHSRVLLLTVVWSSAAAGVLFRVFWLGAPRALYVVLYIAMGWAAVAWMPQFWHTGGPLVVWLIIAGGLVYSAGAVVYARKSPNPSPTWFGFHEIFHACTVVAALCHYAAIAIVSFR